MAAMGVSTIKTVTSMRENGVKIKELGKVNLLLHWRL